MADKRLSAELAMLAFRYALPTIYRLPPITRV